jgi:hypothetical protein
MRTNRSGGNYTPARNNDEKLPGKLMVCGEGPGQAVLFSLPFRLLAPRPGRAAVAPRDPPDQGEPGARWIVFRGNIDGQTQVYAVEVAKARPLRSNRFGFIYQPNLV